MKKTHLPPDQEKDTLTALLTLISEEVRRAEKVKDTAALRDWLDLGCSVLEKFGTDTDLDNSGLKQVMELAAGSGNQFSPDTQKAAEPAESAGSRQPLAYEDNFTPEAAASVLNSCILFCDVVIAGDDSAIGLKYNEEFMFTPMIVLFERNASAGALVWAAENLDVPVIKNVTLAKKLASSGKTGESIPEASCREVSLVFARLGSLKRQWRSGETKKSRQSIPIKIPQPLSVELGESLFSLTGEDPGREKLLAEPLNAIRKKLTGLLGFSIPAFRISRSLRLKTDEYRILFKGLEAGRGRLEIGWYALNRSFGDGAGLRAIPAGAEGSSCYALPDIMKKPENVRAAAKAAVSVIMRHVNDIVEQNAPELLGRDEVEAILDAAEEKYPVVTSEVKSLLSLGIVREVLQGLVSEQVSIRQIAVILEVLADWSSFGPAPGELIIEQIRQSLKRQICLAYTDDKLNLRVLTLESRLENLFADYFHGFAPDAEKLKAAEQKPGEFSPEDWVAHILPSVQKVKEKGFPPVILCSPRARLAVKDAARRRLPELAVLSYMEIPPDINVVPLGEIRLEGSVRFSGNL